MKDHQCLYPELVTTVDGQYYYCPVCGNVLWEERKERNDEK